MGNLNLRTLCSLDRQRPPLSLRTIDLPLLPDGEWLPEFRQADKNKIWIIHRL